MKKDGIVKSKKKKSETPTDNIYLVKISHDFLGSGFLGEIPAINRDEAFKMLKDMLEERGVLERFSICEELYYLETRDMRVRLCDEIAPFAQKTDIVEYYLNYNSTRKKPVNT